MIAEEKEAWQRGWEDAREAAAQVCDEFARANVYYSARAQWAGNVARTIRSLPVRKQDGSR